jgi:hypothetical protein
MKDVCRMRELFSMGRCLEKKMRKMFGITEVCGLKDVRRMRWLFRMGRCLE